MIGTTGVEGDLANRAGISACQVATYTEGATAITAVDSFFLIFCLWPYNRLMVSLFLVALNAGIERITALKFDGDDIAL
ncbi:hypothetical protein GCM10027422_23690 [Hymenobacter arcticus]